MTTYYVDTVDGLDTNAGTSEGAGNAWKTIAKAQATVAAGDVVYIKASGTYDEAVTLTTSGTNTAHIRWFGYTTTPGDNGLVTWTSSTGVCLTTSTITRNWFHNISFDTAVGDCVNCGNFYGGFVNCEFLSSASEGISCTRGTFINCTFANNTSYGLTSVGTIGVYGCDIHGNASSLGQLSCTGVESCMYKCLIYNINTSNSAIVWANDRSFMLACTIDAEGTTVTTGAVNCSAEAPLATVDNIIHDAKYGFNCTDIAGLDFASWAGAHNLFSGVTTTNYWSVSGTYDHEAWGHGGLGHGDVSGSANFTAEVSDDYTLSATSDAVGAGMEPGGPNFT